MKITDQMRQQAIQGAVLRLRAARLDNVAIICQNDEDIVYGWAKWDEGDLSLAMAYNGAARVKLVEVWNENN